MSGSDFVHLGHGLIVPWPAIEAVLAIEARGHRLILEGDDVLVERGHGMPDIEAADIDALRRWRHHAWLIVRYVTTDHAQPEAQPRPPREATR